MSLSKDSWKSHTGPNSFNYSYNPYSSFKEILSSFKDRESFRCLFSAGCSLSMFGFFLFLLTKLALNNAHDLLSFHCSNKLNFNRKVEDMFPA